MPGKRYSVEQIVAKFERRSGSGAGDDDPQVCKRLEISEQTFYRWRTKYGALKEDEAQRLEGAEAENVRLKRIVAGQALDISMLKDLQGETGEPGAPPCRGRVSAAAAQGVGARACQLVGQHRSTQRGGADP